MPCTVRLLPISKSAATFHDFEQYERLVEATKAINRVTELIVLLGGEAGLRCGEMIALEWRDVDLSKRQLCVQRSDWNGEITSPKSGRLRYVPLTVRLTAAPPRASTPSWLASVVSGRRHAVDSTAGSVSGQVRRQKGERQGRRAHPSTHVLLASGNGGAPTRAIQELAGHSELGVTQRYMHLSPAALDAAIQLLDCRGNIVATAAGLNREVGKV